MKKSEKEISKIVRGVKSRGKKWGLEDIRKPDGGLGKQIPILQYTLV